METTRIRSNLLKYLNKNNITCDYIFFSGDMRHASSGGFDVEMIDFLEELCDCVHIAKNQCFIVPGNHDIDRDDETRMEAVNKTYNDYGSGYYDFKEGKICSEDLKSMYNGKRDFVAFLKKFYGSDSEHIKTLSENLNPHYLLETPELNILHVDSTIVYSENRERNLILGTELLQEVFKKLNQTKPTILLTHYSFDFIHRNEQVVLLQLMKEFNVQLWLAGHEHRAFARKQWDYFYEFQCGNLIYEDDYTKACIMLGEYNFENYTGEVTVHSWFEPDGWALYPFLSDEKPVYSFELQCKEEKVLQIKQTVLHPEFRRINDEIYAFNLNELNIEMLRNMSEEHFCEVKRQMGARLSGQESRADVENMFLNEIKMTLNANKRYECMPLFENVLRDVYQGFLYLDENVAPLLKVQIRHFFIDKEDLFLILSETMFFCIVTQETDGNLNREITDITVGYNLGQYVDVSERLLHFEKIRKYLSAKNAFIKMNGHEEYNISFRVRIEEELWRTLNEDTDFWYELMVRIAKIESHYQIKFRLPEKATENDYRALEIIGDSIEKKSCRHLTGVIDLHPGFRRSFTLDEEIFLKDGLELPELQLFGFVFKPVSQYMMRGEYIWDRRTQEWKAKEEDGIPIRVDFELDYDDDKNRELIRIIPYKEMEEELVGKNIEVVNGELADFFRYYIKLTHGFQEIWQLFLLYKEQLEHYIGYDEEENKRLVNRSTGKILDKITVNELVCDVVSAGERLLKKINKVIDWVDGGRTFQQGKFAEEWTNDNLGYLFISAMKSVANMGYFPISVDTNGIGYYNLIEIRYIMQNESNQNLQSFITLLEKEFKSHELNVSKLELYGLFRNYMYVVAVVNKKYYDILQDRIESAVNMMCEILEKHRGFVIDSGELKGYVAFCLDEEDFIHVFQEDSDTLQDFYRFKTEINKYYEDCLIGMKGIELYSCDNDDMDSGAMVYIEK